MARIKKFQDSNVRQMARALYARVNAITSSEEFTKDFGFRLQLRKSIRSVKNNIAKGFGRGGKKEIIHSLCIATESCNELKSQIYMALDWRYISEEIFNECYNLAGDVISKTASMIHYLNKNKYKRKRNRTKTRNRIKH